MWREPQTSNDLYALDIIYTFDNETNSVDEMAELYLNIMPNYGWSLIGPMSRGGCLLYGYESTYDHDIIYANVEICHCSSGLCGIATLTEITYNVMDSFSDWAPYLEP